VFVTVLFLVVQMVGQYGIDHFLVSVIGREPEVEDVIRAARSGRHPAQCDPTYVAGEAAITNKHQLFGLLIAANVGPLITL
jgi:arsenical pump membrane protein